MAQFAHYERIAPATANQSGCIVSPARRLALEARGRRFKSCHPDHFTTQALLTLHQGADAYSVGHRAVTPRSASSVLVQIQVAPPHKRSRGRRQSAGLISQRYTVQLRGLQPIGPLAQPADATPSKGGCSGFESQVAHQYLPRWRNGIRAGLRNQILPVRVRGGAPSTSLAQWIRATGFYPVGRAFESLARCHETPNV